MTATKGVMVVGRDMAIKGTVRNGEVVEVHGYMEGEIAARMLVIREGGTVYGKIKAEAAEVHGVLQGTAYIKNLMTIGRAGSVLGTVQYGQLAMEAGANLSADVRNVPPAVFGDLDLTVGRGQSVRITVMDLTAVDPDDDAASLSYAVSKAMHGFVVLAEAPAQPVLAFTQSDLEGGRVSFRHDGTETRAASFDVVVADKAGATSGEARTVQVTVK